MSPSRQRNRLAATALLTRRTVRLSCVALLAMLLAACAGSAAASDTSPPDGMVDSGSWYVRVPWPHDGHPYEGNRFVVYSDSASLEARRDVAERAERIWNEIISEMSIEPELLGFPPGQEKIDIYAFDDRSPEWAGKAYYGGLVMSSPDRTSLFGLARQDQKRYDLTLKHEMVHVVSEYLLHGRGLAEPPWVPVWFFEGLAEVVSSGTTSGEIRGLDHLDYLTSAYGRLNPVSYKSDEGIEGGPDAFIEFHQPMRQLAVEYLFADQGHGKPLSEATALLADMAGGTGFAGAFADHMGLTATDYEAQFFPLMNDYLPERSRSVIFEPLGLLLMSMITVGAAVLVFVRSIRPSPATATGRTGTVGGSARGGRIGFTLWIAAVGALGVFMYLAGIHGVLGSWSLSAAGKSLGAGILGLYLAASTIALIWAVRVRRNRSWIAWVIPLTVFGAAAVATIAMIVIL